MIEHNLKSELFRVVHEIARGFQYTSTSNNHGQVGTDPVFLQLQKTQKGSGLKENFPTRKINGKKI